MGGASSAFIKAEEELLTKGITWWARWSRPAEPEPTPNVSFTVKNVELGNGLHIHTAIYTHTNSPSKPGGSDGTDKLPLVAMHGYGTGLGIYYGALPILAEKWRGPLFAYAQPVEPVIRRKHVRMHIR